MCLDFLNWFSSNPCCLVFLLKAGVLATSVQRMEQTSTFHPLRWILYNFTRLNAAQIKGKLQYLSEDVLFSNILIHIAHVHISEIEIKNLLEVCDMYVLNQNAINLRDIVFCKFKHQHFFA